MSTLVSAIGTACADACVPRHPGVRYGAALVAVYGTRVSVYGTRVAVYGTEGKKIK